jgi:hypothetical protein
MNKQDRLTLEHNLKIMREDQKKQYDKKREVIIRMIEERLLRK